MASGSLIVIKGMFQQKEFTFSGQINLGRSDNNDVAIKDDVVSRSHAQIKMEGNKFVLYDLGSHNGTKVNGVKTSQTELNDGDTIEIGATVFRFKIEKRPAATEGLGKPSNSSKEKGNSPQPKPKSKRLLFIGGFIVLLAAAVTLFLKPSSPLKKDNPPGAAEKKIKSEENARKKRYQEIKKMAEFSSIEDLVKEAQDRLGIGEKLYKERDITPGNLYRSLQYYEETAALTEHLTPQPEVYQKARENSKIAQEELDRQFYSLKFKVEQAVRLKEWSPAMKSIETLLAAFPDYNDERYKYAKKYQKEVEKHLRKRRKK